MKEQIIIGISIFTLLIISSILTYVFWDIVKAKIPILRYKAGRLWYKFHLFIYVNRMIYKNLKSSTYGSILVNLIFDVFVFYYEHKLTHEANTLAFPEDDFPNGFTDIYELYRWIIETRRVNYEDIYSIEYNEDKDAFEFYSQYFEDFKFTVRSNDELHVKPIQYCEEKDKETKFMYKRMNILNRLYDLDNEKAVWILKRRKYLSL